MFILCVHAKLQSYSICFWYTHRKREVERKRRYRNFKQDILILNDENFHIHII